MTRRHYFMSAAIRLLPEDQRRLTGSAETAPFWVPSRRAFQTVRLTTANDRSPNLSLVAGTMYFTYQRDWSEEHGVVISVKYTGAVPEWTLYIIRQSLYCILAGTGSQYNWRNRDVTWHLDDEPVTTLAAVDSADVSGFREALGSPANTKLQ